MPTPTARPFPVTFAEPLDEAKRQAVLASAKVARWLDGLQANFADVRGVAIDRVYFFGKNVGYVVANADIRRPDGSPVPGIALIRGDSVAVLPILVTPDGEEHTVLVHQSRAAIGMPDFAEIPAGMIDEGVFVSKALGELEEEVGADLEIRAEDLVELETIYPSPGGCDEAIRIYAARKPVPYTLIAALAGRQTGEVSDSERIEVDVVPLAALGHLATADMKTRLAYYSYLAHQGLVPRLSSGPSALEREAQEEMPFQLPHPPRR